MKFIFYDDRAIQCYWLSKSHGTPSAFETVFHQTEWYNFYRINKLTSNDPRGFIQDRSGHIAHPCNIVTTNPYQWRSDSQDFSTVCLKTASKISQHTDRPLAVLWSGGIDSTTALVALLQTVPWERIVVVCNQHSELENPGLFKKIIQPHLQVLSVTDWQQNKDQYFTVSGDAGDTTWAVLDHSAFEQNHNFNQPWRQVLDLSPMEGNTDFLEMFCSWSGRTINTVLELRAWFYLCCKWQSKSMVLFHDNPGLNPQNACAFYDFDDGFSIWTMNNLDKIIGDHWHQYKMPAKKFIFDFDGNTDYYTYKEKEYSVSLKFKKVWHIKNNQLSFAMDQNYNAYGLSCLPFMDMHLFEDWNDQHQLIPVEYLRG